MKTPDISSMFATVENQLTTAINHIEDVINERLPKQQEEKLVKALAELSALFMATRLAKTVLVKVVAQ